MGNLNVLRNILERYLNDVPDDVVVRLNDGLRGLDPRDYMDIGYISEVMDGVIDIIHDDGDHDDDISDHQIELAMELCCYCKEQMM